MPTFITGASGFVGLALTEHLLARGQHVVGYDLQPPAAAALKAFAALPGRFDAETGDVLDAAALRQAMRCHAPDRLVTLAAITADAGRERAAPQAIFDVNVGGVLAALSAAAECGVQRVLHASSGSAYGASGAGSAPLCEDSTPLRPEGLYGISKQAAEAAARRFADIAGLDLVVGRLGTCFGPWEADTGVRDTPSAPLQVLRLARAGHAAVLPRAGLRDWLYVRDAAAGLAALLDAPHRSHATYNIATGFRWTLAQWCEQLAARRPGFRWQLANADAGEPANVDYYAPYDRAPMDCTRLRQDTAFVPRYDLAAAANDFEEWLHHA
ncbi:NAD(P)-dependent oxidoreductase [Ramlibacter sp.]|uniref:NAD-dependent epimerase/dehydratase family protein n=1 Tax=Ramlibacter sp. TaxID=1917967 RepID=UPI00262BC585|nr:NAD(P)-dependent oxidoreductase [Ramlibacter sp.]MDB5954782.1 oxidoreductase [Ramlibacter sp.]